MGDASEKQPNWYARAFERPFWLKARSTASRNTYAWVHDHILANLLPGIVSGAIALVSPKLTGGEIVFESVLNAGVVTVVGWFLTTALVFAYYLNQAPAKLHRDLEDKLKVHEPKYSNVDELPDVCREILSHVFIGEVIIRMYRVVPFVWCDDGFEYLDTRNPEVRLRGLEGVRQLEAAGLLELDPSPTKEKVVDWRTTKQSTHYSVTLAGWVFAKELRRRNLRKIQRDFGTLDEGQLTLLRQCRKWNDLPDDERTALRQTVENEVPSGYWQYDEKYERVLLTYQANRYLQTLSVLAR